MSGEGFLARWSRLKRNGPAAAKPAEAQAPAPVAAAEPAPSAPPAEPAESALPTGEALLAVWRSDPALAAPDPLDMYNLDYPLPDGAEPIASTWQASEPDPVPAAEAEAETVSEEPSADPNPTA